MFCKSCNYPLWNLAPGLCPECGTPFHPSDFDFVPNAVRFLCPHCHQDYYGTDPRGHLSPRAFECVRCRRHVSMDEMLLLPTAGVAEKETRPEPMPWLDRSYGNAVKRWWGTAWRGALAPARLMRVTPRGAGFWPAFRFAAINLTPFGVFGLSFAVLLATMLVIKGAPALLLAAVAGFVLAIALFILWTLLAHAILAITGRTEHPYPRTACCLAYTSGIMLICCIPCLALHLSLLTIAWWSVVAVLAVIEAQRVHVVRAIAAVAIPPLLLGALLIGLLFMGVQRSVTFAATAATGPGGVPYSSVGAIRAGSLLSALQSIRSRDGAYPATALWLLRETGVNPNDYMPASPDPLAGDGLALGGLTFAQLKAASDDKAQAAIAAAGPPPSGPERIGQVVFTYRGIPAGATTPSLWLFITDPEPGPAYIQPGITYRHIGQVDGTVRSINSATLQAELAAENARRADEGLPALPDPDTVK
jgi:hypothetical protein